jgi:hypothetical protein
MNLVMSGFGAKDVLELESFAPSASETVAFTQNATNTGGTLTITDGALHASIRLFGQYVAGGFHLSDDGHGGTAIHYGASSGGQAVPAQVEFALNRH